MTPRQEVEAALKFKEDIYKAAHRLVKCKRLGEETAALHSLFDLIFKYHGVTKPIHLLMKHKEGQDGKA